MDNLIKCSCPDFFNLDVLSVEQELPSKMRNFISSCLLALGLSGIALGQTFEAENGTLSGVTVSTEVTGFTGTGYIVRFENDGASVTWNATIPAAGPYAITARYRAPYGEKYAPIIVQGSEVGQVHFLAGENFTNADALTINLPAGAVTIGGMVYEAFL